MQNRGFAARLRPLERRQRLEGNGSELDFGDAGRWRDLFFAGRSREMGRSAGETHAAQREGNAAGVNSGETGGRLAAGIASKFGSARKRSGGLRIRLVPR